MPTAPFRILYVFVVIERGRRRILHFKITDAPSAQWTGQRLVDAFPDDSAPKFVLRDRDKGIIATRDAHPEQESPSHSGRRA